MTCHEFVDFLMTYLDGGLAEDPLRVFEEHMSVCPPCGIYLDTYRETIRLGKFACTQAGSGVPEDVPEALIQAIMAAREA